MPKHILYPYYYLLKNNLYIPKPNTKKKYITWGTNFGSIDNHFIDPKTKQLSEAVFHDHPYVVQVQQAKTNEIKANILNLSLLNKTLFQKQFLKFAQ